MRVIEVVQAGGPDQLQFSERAIPASGKNEVLIKVEAIGMNHADLAQRRGFYPPPEGAPDLLGLEVSGRIVAIGENATRWNVDDQVCALLPGGGYAEYAVAHEDLCLPIPKRMSFVEAATLPEAYATVWMNVFMKAALQPGENLLVHGGSSGIGMTTIQLAKYWGANVWATAGSPEKCEACREIGAHVVINYKSDDFETVIKRQPTRMHVIFDMVGGEYLDKNLRLLHEFGRLGYISALGGREPSINLVTLMKKNATIFGSVLRRLSVHKKAHILQQMEKNVWHLFDQGILRPIPNHVFPWSQVQTAHTRMDRHEHIGKQVLVVE